MQKQVKTIIIQGAEAICPLYLLNNTRNISLFSLLYWKDLGLRMSELVDYQYFPTSRSCNPKSLQYKLKNPAIWMTT
jgi:hypothetical protein